MSRAKLICSLVLPLFLLTSMVLHTQAQAAPPTTPPAPICGDTDLLSGPSTPPAGAITVPAGDNSGFEFNRPGATFWFAPGVHTFGTHIYGQIIARSGTTYIGGPGAILDGQNANLYAFTNDVPNVTIKYLTIRNFGTGLSNHDESVVNHDSGVGWVMEYNTITANDGAGLFVGTDNVVRYNCLKDNGQYGYSSFKPPVDGRRAITNIVLDHNEIVGNATDDWETIKDGCGCTGAGKFWDIEGARVTNNWVHHNHGTGIWADTNNVDFLIEGNYVDSNEGEGIWYEISYNATIRNNLLRNNAWGKGHADQGSPAPGVYISESGGDARLPSVVSGAPQVRVYGNRFENNFSGITIFENANRFCNANGNTSKGYCTPFVSPTILPEPWDTTYANPIKASHPCYTQVANEPYRTNCRWNAQNVEVFDNDFVFDPTVVPCVGTRCGVQALYATGENNIPWSPYTVAEIQDDVMFRSNNRFHDNRYVGPWRFLKGAGDGVSDKLTSTAWRAAPYNQDAGSTFEGDTEPSDPSRNHLDADTSTLEGSIGKWSPWYSTTIARSTDAAHWGTQGLRVDITARFGWGVEMSNWPGWAATPGTKEISFWGKLGAGSNLQPRLTVKWLDSQHTVLATHSVALPALTTSWQKQSALVDAPAGTSTALVTVAGTSGRAGNYLYLDDFVVGDVANVLDAATADFEGSVGRWQPWFSSSIASTTQESRRGTGSLRVDVTAPWGWGVQLDNWPGFDTTAGAKRVSYWAKQGTSGVSAVTLRLKWLDADHALLGQNEVTLSGLTTSWRQALANVTAPAGTARVYAELTGGSGTSGDAVYVDDVVIAAVE